MKQPPEISCEYLTKIWNDQVIMQKNFPNELILVGITIILKRDNSTLAKICRPVSVLPCVSKIFLENNAKADVSIHRKMFITIFVWL